MTVAPVVLVVGVRIAVTLFKNRFSLFVASTFDGGICIARSLDCAFLFVTKKNYTVYRNKCHRLYFCI